MEHRKNRPFPSFPLRYRDAPVAQWYKSSGFLNHVRRFDSCRGHRARVRDTVWAARCKRRRAKHDSGPRKASAIRHVVVHSTEGGTAASVASFFATTARASTQLVVDEVECYRCVPDLVIPWGAPGVDATGLHARALRVRSLAAEDVARPQRDASSLGDEGRAQVLDVRYPAPVAHGRRAAGGRAWLVPAFGCLVRVPPTTNTRTREWIPARRVPGLHVDAYYTEIRSARETAAAQ